MKNKTVIIGILLSMAIALFLLPSVYSQSEIYDSVVVIGFENFQENDNLTDGKQKMLIRVTGAATNTLSGYPDSAPYLDKVTIEVNKPNKFDEKIVASIKARELNFGRNVTKITWVDQKQIYP